MITGLAKLLLWRNSTWVLTATKYTDTDTVPEVIVKAKLSFTEYHIFPLSWGLYRLTEVKPGEWLLIKIFLCTFSTSYNKMTEYVSLAYIVRHLVDRLAYHVCLLFTSQFFFYIHVKFSATREGGGGFWTQCSVPKGGEGIVDYKNENYFPYLVVFFSYNRHFIGLKFHISYFWHEIRNMGILSL